MFCSFRDSVAPIPFDGTLSLAKPRKTLAQTGGRGETGFLPGIQKPDSPRLLRPFPRCRQLTICMEAFNRPRKSLNRPPLMQLAVCPLAVLLMGDPFAAN